MASKMFSEVATASTARGIGAGGVQGLMRAAVPGASVHGLIRAAVLGTPGATSKMVGVAAAGWRSVACCATGTDTPTLGEGAACGLNGLKSVIAASNHEYLPAILSGRGYAARLAHTLAEQKIF